MSGEMLFMQLTLKGKAVEGDSMIKGFEKQIALRSMQWGFTIKDQTAAKGTTAAIKNWEAKELSISKFMDGSSTAIYGHVDEREGLRSSARSTISQSKTDNKAIISFVSVTAREGEKMPVYLRVTLAGCRIHSISTKASESGPAMSLIEDLDLTFQDLEIEYFPPVDDRKRSRGAATKFELRKKVD